MLLLIRSVHPQCFWRCAADVAAVHVDCQVAALVAVLKVARQLGLISELGRVALPGQPPVTIPGALLRQAMSHGNEGLLVDAMTLACVHPKTAAMPGARTYFGFSYPAWTTVHPRTKLAFVLGRLTHSALIPLL